MKRIFLLFVLTFLFYLPFSSNSSSEEKPNPRQNPPANEKVESRVGKKTYDEALKEYAKNRGDQLFSEGENFYKKGDHTKAIEKWTEALKFFEDADDKESQEIILGNIGNAFDESGNYSKALEYYQEGLRLSRELDDRAGTGEFLTNMGSSYWNLGQYQKALENYLSALKIDEELKDKKSEEGDLSNIAGVYSKLKEYEKSLEYYQKAIAKARELLNKKEESNLLTRMGDLFVDRSNPSKALEEYLGALAIAEEIKDEASANEIKKKIDEAKKLSQKKIALEQEAQEEGEGKGKAEAKTEAKAEMKAEEKKTEGEKSGTVGFPSKQVAMEEAKNLIKEGDSLFQDKKYKRAAENYIAALVITKTAGDTALSSDLGFKIAESFLMAEDKKNSVDFMNQGLTIKKVAGDKRGEADGLIKLGNIFYHFGDYQESSKRYEEAAKAESAIGNKTGFGVSRINLADIYRLSSLYGEAKKIYIEGLKIASEIPDTDLIWRAQYGLGVINEKENNTDQSLRYFMEAIKIINSKRNEFSPKEAKGLITDEEMLFDDLKYMLFKLHGKDKGKGYDKLAFLYDEMSEELKFEKELLRMGVPLGQKKEQSNFPEKPFSIYDAQKLSLKGSDEVLLKYCVLKDMTYLFVVNKKNIVTIKINLVGDDLEDMIVSLRDPIDKLQNITDTSAFYKSLEEVDLNVANTLYNSLIEPAREYIKGARVLLIVPSGVLSYLPFEMLVEKVGERKKNTDVIFAEFSDSTYLTEEFSVNYAASAKKFSKKGGISLSQFKHDLSGKLLSIGDYGGLAEDLVTVFGKDTKILKEAEATKAGFKELAQKFPFVNISLPVWIDDDISRTGIIFSEQKNNRILSELLNAYELYSLNSDPKFFVLDNCEYNLSSYKKDNGIEYLLNSLTGSGSSAVLNLWRLDEKTAGDFLKEFFSLLTETTSTSDVVDVMSLTKIKLKQAVKELGSSPHKISYSHPYFWASFVLEGRSYHQ